MISNKKIHQAVHRHIKKMLLTPIEVFVFHAVSDEYDESLNMRTDWTSTEEFKCRILDYQKQYKFISLAEAYKKLTNDKLRRGRYAVLTCDDGFLSVLNIIPFLEEKRIPVTLFVNPKYLDGVSKREDYVACPRYITKKDLFAIGSEYVSIGLHGYEHNDVTKLTEEEFRDAVNRCEVELSGHPRYIPFFAYTWGKYSEQTQCVLRQKNLIPVFTDGNENYRYVEGIGRKPIDNYYINR